MKNKAGKAIIMSTALLSFANIAFGAEAEVLDDYVLEDIVVTASRMPEKVFEAKADVSVVNRSRIEEQHFETVEDTLRTVPGTQFTNYGANGLNGNISSVRINGSKDVVVLVDGVRVGAQEAGNGGEMYSSLMSNMDNIERVEVLRGSAATVYGSGAKGGVINIITRKPTANKTTVDLSTGTGKKRTMRFHTMGRVDDNRLAYTAYFNKAQTGDTIAGDGRRWPGKSDTNSGGAKLIYDITKDHSLTMAYDDTNSKFRGHDFVYEDDYDGRYVQKMFTLQDKLKIDKHWSNLLTYRRTHLDSDYLEIYDSGATPDHIVRNETSSFVSEQLSFSDKCNDTIFGYDYSYTYDNDKKRIGFDEWGDPIYGNHYIRNHSFFAQETWKFAKGFSLMGGIRHDRPGADGNAPKFATHTSKSWKLSYEPTKRDTIYFGRSDFYILPSMNNLFVTTYGNDKLKPAEGVTTTVGYTHKFNENTALTFNCFKTYEARGIAYDGSKYANFDGGESRGWNLQFISKLSKLWSVNVGWAHLKQNNIRETFLENGYAPKDKLTFDIIYKLGKLTAGLDGFYFIRNTTPTSKDAFPKDKYGIYNLSLTYSPEKNYSIYLRMNNIFDTLWAEHTDVPYNPGKAGNWYSMPGRVITLGVKFSF